MITRRGLRTAGWIETRSGLRPVSADGAPVRRLGPGLTVITGLGARGLTIGPYAGRLAADLVRTS